MTFVAVAYDSNIAATSEDGITWTQRTLPVNTYWDTVTYGGGVFVAISSSLAADAATSPDGITWTARTLPVVGWYPSVAYGAGLFVAVKYGSDVALTSPDGITWTSRTMPLRNWRSVTYGNGVFVAVASNSTVAATSPDGITWTERTLPVSATWVEVAYGNGLFVATTASGGTIYATSPDGITWTQRTFPVASYIYLVTYAAGVFVAVRWSIADVATSADAITWTTHTVPVAEPDGFYDITYGDGQFVAVVYRSAIAATSPDGITWTQRTLPANVDWVSVACQPSAPPPDPEPDDPTAQTPRTPRTLDPDATVPARSKTCTNLLDMIREFSTAVKGAVRIVSGSTIEMVDPDEPLPTGWAADDGDECYSRTTQTVSANTKVLRLSNGYMDLAVSADIVTNDAGLLTGGFRIPGRLPGPHLPYGLDPAPVSRVSYTLTPTQFSASVDLFYPDTPLIVRER